MAATSTPATGRIKLPVKDQWVEDLLLWRDVKKSGAVFAGITGVFLFFQFAKYNVVTLVAYALFFLVVALPLWRLVGPRIGRPAPPLPRVLTQGVSEAEVRTHVDRVVPVINRGLRVVQRAVSGQDPMFTLIAAAGLFATARISAFLSLLTLAYLPVLAAFTLPKVYELRKDDIDQGMNTGRAKLTSVYDKYVAGIVAKIPRAGAPSPAESTSRKFD